MRFRIVSCFLWHAPHRGARPAQDPSATHAPRTTARARRARALRRERRPGAKLACGRPERPSDGTAMRRGCAVLMAPLLAPLGAVQTHSWRGRVYQRLSPVCRAEKHTVRFDRQSPVRCRHVVDPRHCPRPTPAPWTLTRPTAARTRNGHERILAGPSAKLMGQVHAFHDREIPDGRNCSQNRCARGATRRAPWRSAWPSWRCV